MRAINTHTPSRERNNNWDTGDIATVTVAGQTVSYTVATDATTDATVAGALLTSLQALDLDGISFAAGGSADQIAITSTRSFEDIDVAVGETSTTGDGNAYLLDINGTATGNTTTETGTINQRAEEVFFTTDSQPQPVTSMRANEVTYQDVYVPIGDSPRSFYHLYVD